MRNLASIRKLLVVAALALAPMASFAGIFISVGFAPPALPVYVQPVCPGDGFLWNPGYWAYGPEGYYWVPGVWVQPPTVGYLWTPPYWGFAGGVYGFHEGYWGPHVGFYGGVNYGFGFFGSGYAGGRWEGGRFAYNRAVNNVNVTNIHNTYVDRTVINNVNVSNHTSFNGGPGGLQARPGPQELAVEREHHVAPTPQQQSHIEAAHTNPQNFARTNGGHPQVAAFQRPGSTVGAVPARGAVSSPAAAQQHNAPNPQAARGGFGGQQQPQVRTAQPQAEGRTAQPQARPQAQSQGQFAARPQYQPQAQPQARPQPQTQSARPQQQARPAAQPHPQAAPRSEGREGGNEHPR